MWDLVPQPGIEPGPPALGAQSLTHWATWEVPSPFALNWPLNSTVFRVISPHTFQMPETFYRLVCTLLLVCHPHFLQVKALTIVLLQHSKNYQYLPLVMRSFSSGWWVNQFQDSIIRVWFPEPLKYIKLANCVLQVFYVLTDFCQLVLSVPKGGRLKFPNIIEYLSIPFFSSFRFCFKYFGALLLGTFKLRVIMTS